MTLLTTYLMTYLVAHLHLDDKESNRKWKTPFVHSSLSVLFDLQCLYSRVCIVQHKIIFESTVLMDFICYL